MTAPTPAHRVYFALVGLFALWVGIWGYFVPAEIVRAIPWPVPPLHGRFIGAMYLSGMVLMGLALVARRLAEVQTAVIMAAVWTGMLLLVSLFHLDEFDFGHTPVWFWFGAYIAYPLMGAWLAYAHRPEELPAGTAPAPDWVRFYFIGQGAACVTLAALLFFVPAWMASVWPWKISVLLAQIYSGPFLSYGVGSFLLARCAHWIELRIVVGSMATFAALVLIASYLHSAVFTPAGLAASLWFGGFIIVAVALFVIAVHAIRAGTTR